jgi:hypothetical protein
VERGTIERQPIAIPGRVWLEIKVEWRRVVAERGYPRHAPQKDLIGRDVIVAVQRAYCDPPPSSLSSQ